VQSRELLTAHADDINCCHCQKSLVGSCVILYILSVEIDEWAWLDWNSNRIGPVLLVNAIRFFSQRNLTFSLIAFTVYWL